MDIIVPFLEEEKSLLNDLIQVVRGKLSRRQTGEMGKFVDEILQFTHLLDDGRRTLIENRPIPVEQFCITSSERLGSKLDGRQWIFDFVSNTARDFAPCLHPLNLLNLRDVLEKDHDAHGLSLIVPQSGRRHYHCQQLVQ